MVPELHREILASAKILIVDDQKPNLDVLEKLFARQGYRRIQSTQDSLQALPLFLDLMPDIVLLDLNMPHMDGYAVMRQIRTRIPADEYLPILILTADTTSEAKMRALSDGARDFLAKPLDIAEVALRTSNLLETRFLYSRLRNQNEILELKVRQRTAELHQAEVETLERLAMAAEYRDDCTGQHTRRVGHVSALLAQALGLPEWKVEFIRQAAPLHDVGKIGIPDQILLKPGRLTHEEFEIIKTHTAIGARMLSGSTSPLLQFAEEIALTHHERWDGAGYTRLPGSAIPLAGQIVAVADTFDALTHVRPYKQAWPVAEASREIQSQGGQQFDPNLVRRFMEILPAVAPSKYPANFG
jgi:putative two-component system response regulator